MAVIKARIEVVESGRIGLFFHEREPEYFDTPSAAFFHYECYAVSTMKNADVEAVILENRLPLSYPPTDTMNPDIHEAAASDRFMDMLNTIEADNGGEDV